MLGGALNTAATVHAAEPKGKTSAKVGAPAGPAATAQAEKEEAAAISQVAAAKDKEGDYAMCASLFQRAYQTDPSYLGYLFSAARCEQKAGDLDAAERDYRLFLARNPKGDKLSEKAQQQLDQILAERKKGPVAGPAAVGKPADTADPKLAAPPTPADLAHPATPTALPPQATSTRAWVAIVTGGALVAAGMGLTWSGLGLRTDLENQLAQRQQGLIVGMTPVEAHERESAYRLRLGAGVGGAVVGAAVLGAGIWWLGDKPGAASLTTGPAPLGIGLAWAWR